MNPALFHPLLLLIVAASVGVARAGDEPPNAVQRPKVRTLELRVGRDKQLLSSDPEQRRQLEQFYRSLEEQAKLCVVPLQRHLQAQAHFIGTVCQFDESRRADLGERCHAIAQAALDRLTEAIFARRNYGNVGITVDGIEVRIPAGVHELFLRSPREAARQELDQALADELSVEARAQLDAERERAAGQAREADVLMQVSLLDEALLLSAEQREDFRKLLALKWTDAWRPPEAVEVFFGAMWTRTTAAGFGGPFQIPEVEITARLRPAQAALLQQRGKENLARINGPNSSNGVFAGAAVASLDDQLLATLVDDVSVACGLSEEQLAKLQLAGALAIERQRAAAREQPAAPVEQRPQTLAVDIAWFSTMLAEERSPYFKALRSTLTSAQRTRLTEAHAERQRFHERAMLADVVRKVSDRAVLTTAQREQLQAFLVARLDDMPEADPALGPRLGQLPRIVAIRPMGLEEPADFRALFDDFQRPLEIETWMSLERDLAAQRARRGVPAAMPRGPAAGLNMF